MEHEKPRRSFSFLEMAVWLFCLYLLFSIGQKLGQWHVGVPETRPQGYLRAIASNASLLFLMLLILVKNGTVRFALLIGAIAVICFQLFG